MKGPLPPVRSIGPDETGALRDNRPRMRDDSPCRPLGLPARTCVMSLSHHDMCGRGKSSHTCALQPYLSSRKLWLVRTRFVR